MRVTKGHHGSLLGVVITAVLLGTGCGGEELVVGMGGSGGSNAGKPDSSAAGGSNADASSDGTIGADGKLPIETGLPVESSADRGEADMDGSADDAGMGGSTGTGGDADSGGAVDAGEEGALDASSDGIADSAADATMNDASVIQDGSTVEADAAQDGPERIVLCTFDYSDAGDPTWGGGACAFSASSGGDDGVVSASTDDQSGSLAPGSVNFKTNFAASNTEVRVRSVLIPSVNWRKYSNYHIWVKVVTAGSVRTIRPFVGTNGVYYYGTSLDVGAFPSGVWVDVPYDLTVLLADGGDKRNTIGTVGLELVADEEAGALTQGEILMDNLSVE